MTTVFDKSDEWGGYTIKLGSTGFLIDFHTHIEGELDGLRVLVPFGTWQFDAKADLHRAHDEMATNGEALAEMALIDAAKPIEERSIEVIDEGRVLDVSKRKKEAEAELRREAARHREEIDSHSSWYAFSLHKDDEDGYGRCHDFFTAMYLAHGMPHGMALWTRSNFATDENIFFAQIPDGVEVKDDPFFAAFPLAGCEHPSKIGLSLMVGHLDEAL